MDKKQFHTVLSRMAAQPERQDWATGTIEVDRYGLVKPYFLFRQNQRVLARLEWPRGRDGRYQAEDGTLLDLAVEKMGTRLVAKDRSSRISTLEIKRRVNQNRAKMIICLSDAECFLIQQRVDKVNPRHLSWHITKEFYVTELFDIQIVDLPHRGYRHRAHSRTIALIRINPLMKWEARHFHHLMALLIGHLIFVGGQDRFHFDTRRNRYFSPQGVCHIRHGRKIPPHPPRR